MEEWGEASSLIAKPTPLVIPLCHLHDSGAKPADIFAAYMLDLRLLAQPAPSCLLLLPDYIHHTMMNMHRSKKGSLLTAILTVYAVHDVWRLLVL